MKNFVKVVGLSTVLLFAAPGLAQQNQQSQQNQNQQTQQNQQNQNTQSNQQSWQNNQNQQNQQTNQQMRVQDQLRGVVEEQLRQLYNEFGQVLLREIYNELGQFLQQIDQQNNQNQNQNQNQNNQQNQQAASAQQQFEERLRALEGQNLQRTLFEAQQRLSNLQADIEAGRNPEQATQEINRIVGALNAAGVIAQRLEEMNEALMELEMLRQQVQQQRQEAASTLNQVVDRLNQMSTAQSQENQNQQQQNQQNQQGQSQQSQDQQRQQFQQFQQLPHRHLGADCSGFGSADFVDCSDSASADCSADSVGTAGTAAVDPESAAELAARCSQRWPAGAVEVVAGLVATAGTAETAPAGSVLAGTAGTVVVDPESAAELALHYSPQ